MQISEAVSRIEIRDALQRYARGLDRRDLALAMSAFHDDAQVVHGHFSGRGHEWVDWVFANPPIDRVGVGGGDPRHDVVESQQHHLTNQLIELDGETAFSEAYYLEHTLTLRGTVRYLTSVGGRYVERYERRAGVWRIALSHAVRDWDSVQLVGARFPGWENAPRGSRTTADPSYQADSGKGMFSAP